MKETLKYRLTLSLLSTFDDLLTDVLVDQVSLFLFLFSFSIMRLVLSQLMLTTVNIVILLVQDSEDAWAISEQSEDST